MKFNYLFVLFALSCLSFLVAVDSRKKIVATPSTLCQATLSRRRLPEYFNRVVVLPCYYHDQDSPLLEYIDKFSTELAQERIFGDDSPLHLPNEAALWRRSCRFKQATA